VLKRFQLSYQNVILFFFQQFFLFYHLNISSKLIALEPEIQELLTNFKIPSKLIDLLQRSIGEFPPPTKDYGNIILQGFLFFSFFFLFSFFFVFLSSNL